MASPGSDSLFITAEEGRVARAALYSHLERGLRHVAVLIRTRTVRRGDSDSFKETVELALQLAHEDRALLDVIGWSDHDRTIALAGFEERTVLTRALHASMVEDDSEENRRSCERLAAQVAPGTARHATGGA